jgi:hypothetical protein
MLGAGRATLCSSALPCLTPHQAHQPFPPRQPRLADSQAAQPVLRVHVHARVVEQQVGAEGGQRGLGRGRAGQGARG